MEISTEIVQNVLSNLNLKIVDNCKMVNFCFESYVECENVSKFIDKNYNYDKAKIRSLLECQLLQTNSGFFHTMSFFETDLECLLSRGALSKIFKFLKINSKIADSCKIMTSYVFIL